MTKDRPSNEVRFLLDEGHKADEGKARLDLVYWPLVFELAKVLEHGAKKYGDTNYRLVHNARRRYFAAGMRHFLAWWNGEKIDPDTGLTHLSHLLANIQILYEADQADDRSTDTNP